MRLVSCPARRSRSQLRRTRAAEGLLSGAYDKGTYIADLLPMAEMELLKEREEANDE